MRNTRVAPGVQKSLYPLDHNPATGFNEWAEYIRQQNYANSMGGSSYYLISINCALLARAIEAKRMLSLVKQANEIINNAK